MASDLLTFETPVTIEAYHDETAQRKKMLAYYLSGDGTNAVAHARSVFGDLKSMSESGGLTKTAITAHLTAANAREYTVLNMQADQADAFRLKYVNGVIAGKPTFTDNKNEAMKVDGVFFFPNGVVVRVFTGFVPALKEMRTQATVELLNTEVTGVDITQQWVDDNIRGLSSYAFKVNADGICPAGMWAQYGVDPQKKTELIVVMDSCHLPVKSE